MSLLSFLIWNPDPEIFTLSFTSYAPRWYGLLFAGGFILAQQVAYYLYRKDGVTEKELERLTLYMVVATVVGARLGHCLFYDPVYYLTHPLDILKIWEGGLASHGGAVAILLALWIYVRKTKKQSYLWILDRMVIAICVCGAFIRLGNFMNSEIIGKETDANFGVVFARDVHDVMMALNRNIVDVDFRSGTSQPLEVPHRGLVPMTILIEFDNPDISPAVLDNFFSRSLSNIITTRARMTQHIFQPEGQELKFHHYKSGGTLYGEVYVLGIARHPAQLYESIFCLLLFALLFAMWYYKRDKLPDGYIFAWFLIILWSLRFIVEFFKINQVDFEDNIPLNMGQWLSIPLIIAGIVLLIRVTGKQKKEKEKVSVS